MTAVKYVSAIICFGLGVALAFAAVQSMYSSVGLGDNPGGPIVAGVGAMFLLVTHLLLRPSELLEEFWRYRHYPERFNSLSTVSCAAVSSISK